MGPYVAISLALCLVQVSLLRWTGTKWFQIFGVVVSLSWAIALSLSWWNPLGWYVATDQTLAYLTAGLVALCAGSMMPMLFGGKARATRIAAGDWDRVPLAKIATWLTLLGVPLLVLFVVAVVLPSGLSSDTLKVIRIAGNSGFASIGLYYFYPFQLAAALWWMSWRQRRVKWHLMAAILVTVTLVLTSGRTNILFVLAWLGFVSLLSPSSRDHAHRLAIVPMAALAGVGLAVFTAMGNAVGKTFQNSALSRSILDANGIPEWLVQPIYYFGGALAGLAYKLDNNAAAEGWSQALLPAAKISSAVWGMESPDDLQNYVFMPYPTNVFSGMGPFLMASDSRWEGIAGLFVLGTIVGLIFRSWRTGPDPLNILMYAMVLAGAVSFPFDNLFAKPFFWVYLLILIALRTYWRQSEKQVGDRNHNDDLEKRETPSTEPAPSEWRSSPERTPRKELSGQSRRQHRSGK